MPNLPPHTPFTRRPAREHQEAMSPPMRIARKAVAAGKYLSKAQPKIGVRRRLRLKGALLVLDPVRAEAPC
jgi:hypothetical protein